MNATDSDDDSPSSSHDPRRHDPHRRHRHHGVNWPRDFNRWVIPAGVLVTIGFWVAVITLLASDKDPEISTDEAAIFGAAQIATVSSVLYAKEYILHRSSAADHQLLRAEFARCQELTQIQIDELRGIVMEFRGRVVIAAGETRSGLEQISAKQTAKSDELIDLLNDIRHLYWQNLADKLGSGDTGPTPFRRRT